MVLFGRVQNPLIFDNLCGVYIRSNKENIKIKKSKIKTKLLLGEI
jgi:hypothetical protein